MLIVRVAFEGSDNRGHIKAINGYRSGVCAPIAISLYAFGWWRGGVVVGACVKVMRAGRKVGVFALVYSLAYSLVYSS